MTRKVVYAIRQDPTKVFRRPLSAKGASSCEAAHLPVCLCRCGGVLHGKSHEGFQEAIEARLTDGGTMTRGESEELAGELLAELEGITPTETPSSKYVVKTPAPLPCEEDAAVTTKPKVKKPTTTTTVRVKANAELVAGPARGPDGRYIRKA